MSTFLSRRSTTLGLTITLLVLGVAGATVAVPRTHAAHISGASITKHSIAGNRLKPNTLTGKQIKESTLGKVPSAHNAASLGGVPAAGYVRTGRFFHFTVAMNRGAPAKVVGSYGPLTLRETCSADVTSTEAELTATVTAGPLYLDGETNSNGDTAVLLDADSASADFPQTDDPTAYLGSGGFALDGGDAVTAIVNTSDADCVFMGHLMNVA